MRSTTSLMPGERVSCVGCHESKREVSYGPISGALKQPARVLATWIDLNATFYGCYEEPWLSKQLKGERIPMPERQ